MATERKFQVGLTLDQTSLNQIDEACKLTSVSRSVAVRAAIALYHHKVTQKFRKSGNPPKETD